MKRILTIAALAILVSSCSSSYEKTKSGLTYKIIKGKGGAKLKAGDIIKITGTVTLSPKDSVLYKTHIPDYLPFDTSTRSSYDYNEVLKFCSVGDSIITVAQVDTLMKKGNNLPPSFKRGDQIITGLRIMKVFSQEQAMKDQQEEMKSATANEIIDLEKELAKKGVKAEKTENGVFVEILNPGTPEKIQANKQVTVKYTGSLIETGKKFDSNVDTSFHHAQPFDFVVGQGRVIRGWEEGITKIGAGGKANLYIPSMMGYGPQGSPPVIPRFAALKFEIEVVNVKDAPPPPPAMPMGMPQRQGAMPQGDPRRQMQEPRHQQAPPQQQAPKTN